MTELNDTLWNFLQTIQWSYAALWTLTPDRRMLKWHDGWFNLKTSVGSRESVSNSRNAELFYYLYNQLTFAPGVGFAGHALKYRGDSILWLAGDVALENIPKPVVNQSLFIKAAEIQTAICVPLQDKVLELGTSNMVPEDDELAHYIKKLLYSLLERYLNKPQLSHLPDPAAFTPNVPAMPPAAGLQAGAEPSSLPVESLIIPDLPPVYDDVNEIYSLPQVAMTAAESLQSGLMWTSQQLNVSLMQSDLGLWSTTSGLASLQGSQTGVGISTSCGPSELLIDPIEPHVVPSFNLSVPFMESDGNLLAAAAAAVTIAPSTAVVSPQNAPECTITSLERSSSSVFLEDNEISSVANVFTNSQTSDSKVAFQVGRDLENWMPPRTRARRSISPQEASPESSSSTWSKARVIPTPGSQQQAPIMPDSSQKPALGRRSLSTGKLADTTPVLLQVGNVLQLGNASGEVAEALPQEHDEAAVSHMLAERRRRIKQNENFTQLKALIPTAAKMDKASLLAETVVYINKLKAQLEAVEQSNQSLKFLVGDRVQEVAGPSSPPRPNSTDPVEVTHDGDGNLRIEIRSSSSQPDSAIQILTALKQMQLKVLNSQMALGDDDSITATFVVKMKRKNPTGQTEVCALVKRELRRCLGL